MSYIVKLEESIVQPTETFKTWYFTKKAIKIGLKSGFKVSVEEQS